MLYHVWQIKDKDGTITRELKLRLTSRTTVELEKRIGCNPVDKLMGVQGGLMPTTQFIAEALRASLQKFEHGYDEGKVLDLIDEFIENGGTLMDIVAVLVEVFKVSGFFKAPATEMTE